MAYDEVVESGPPVVIPSSTTVSFSSDITEWPWPRILATKYRVLGLFKQTNNNIYVFEMYLTNYGRWEIYAVRDLGPASLVAQFDVADFGPFYIISTLGYDSEFNRVVQTFIRDTALVHNIANRDVFGINFMTQADYPVFATCANFNGQLVGGNVYSPSEDTSNYWLDKTTNSIVWSAIGSFELSPLVDKTAGWREVLGGTSSGSTKSNIYKILPLQDGVIVYSDYGNSMLMGHTVGGVFTYGLVPLKGGGGVTSGNHVAGDDHTHGMIDLNREFWRLDPDKKWTRLGYKDYISDMFDTGAPVIVSYLPYKRQFYISNGLSCLVVNDFGAATVHQGVSGVLQGHDGKLYGSFTDTGNLEGRVTLDSTDFNSRGLKTLESLILGIRVEPSTRVSVGSYWKMTKSSSQIRSNYRPSGPRGETVIHVTAEEFRPHIKFSTYEGSEISYWSANVKFSDSRFRRGPTIQAQGSQPQQG